MIGPLLNVGSGKPRYRDMNWAWKGIVFNGLNFRLPEPKKRLAIQFTCVGDVELGFDVGAVSFNRFHTEL